VVKLTSGTIYGCELTSGNNDQWQVRDVNISIRYADASSSYDRFMSMLVMSDGNANTKIGHRRGFDSGNADVEAVAKACEAFDNYGIRVYSVAFGAGADEVVMEDIACCDDCSHAYDADNAEELTDIYSQIANDIIELQYAAQAANVTGNVSTVIYPDSYIMFNYTPDVNQSTYGVIPLTIESPRFGNNVTNGSFYVPNTANIYEAKLTSYSADRWTDRALIRNSSGNWASFFDLSSYGDMYISLGDPYIVDLPVSMVNYGDNYVHVSTALGPGNESIGSNQDRAIYKIGVNMEINYTGIFGYAEGCNWSVEFEDNTSMTFPIPSDYSGDQECIFNASTNCNAEFLDDAIDNAICNLFAQIDFDNDGKLFVKFGSDDLNVDVFSIGKIPFMWGPTMIDVRVWR